MPSRGDRTYLLEFESLEQRKATHAATRALGMSTQGWMRKQVATLLAEHRERENEKAAA